jgi:hypothetical protein
VLPDPRFHLYKKDKRGKGMKKFIGIKLEIGFNL